MDFVFIQIEGIEVIFSKNKEAHYCDIPTPSFEFSSTRAQR